MNKELRKNYQILIVDDERLIRESLYEIFRMEGYRVQMAQTAEEAIEVVKKENCDVVISDFKLPKMTGIDLLIQVKKINPEIEFILITGYGSIESAVDAMKLGAFDYITKPINDSEIKIIINKIVEKRHIIDENKALRKIISKDHKDIFYGMIGVSERIQKVYSIIDSVASTNATILITGESGTGKGLVAKAIHDHDQNRKGKPFVEISCGALSETLLESELFGHVKGAFTGAIKDKEGRFEYAKDGTIFLDEIDTFTLPLQVKLLRVLQDGVFERVGDNVTQKAQARILVATNQNLVNLIKEGKFREDLYYRVNVISIEMPSLKHRREDIELLVDYFIKKYNKINNKNIKGVSLEVINMFKDYHWPGNVRELENAIEGSVIMSRKDVIAKEDIPSISKFENQIIDNTKEKDNEKNLKKIVAEPEKEHIINVLKECGWNRNKAAIALGINRTTLYNKMKKYSISDF